MDKLIDEYSRMMQTESDNTELGESTKLMMEHQLRDNSLRVMVSFSDGTITHEDIDNIVKSINDELNR